MTIIITDDDIVEDDTLQRTIDFVCEHGGGKVILRRPMVLSAPIIMKANVMLEGMPLD